MIKKLSVLIAALFMLSLGAVACGDDDDNGNGGFGGSGGTIGGGGTGGTDDNGNNGGAGGTDDNGNNGGSGGDEGEDEEDEFSCTNFCDHLVTECGLEGGDFWMDVDDCMADCETETSTLTEEVRECVLTQLDGECGDTEEQTQSVIDDCTPEEEEEEEV